MDVAVVSRDDHLVSRHEKRARSIAIAIHRAEMLREARVLEFRFFIFVFSLLLLILLFFLLIILLFLIAIRFVIAAAIVISSGSSHGYLRTIFGLRISRKKNLGIGLCVCSCRACALDGCGFGARLRLWRLIVCIIVARLWRAFGHVDSGSGGTFMALYDKGKKKGQSSP